MGTNPGAHRVRLRWTISENRCRTTITVGVVAFKISLVRSAETVVSYWHCKRCHQEACLGKRATSLEAFDAATAAAARHVVDRHGKAVSCAR